MKFIAAAEQRYGDLMYAIYAAMGDRPFTAADLREKGIRFPGGYGSIRYLKNRGVLVVRRAGRPNQWALADNAIGYLERRHADADRR